MQNAHLRLGLLEYHRITEKTSTRVRVRVPVAKQMNPVLTDVTWATPAHWNGTPAAEPTCDFGPASG